MIKAVLLDLDDTLYYERQYVLSGFSEVARDISARHGISQVAIFTMLKEDFDRGVRGNNFDRLLGKLALEDETVDELVRIYREHMPRLTICPDSAELLESLKDRYLMGVITDGHTVAQQNKIAVLGIGHYFDCIVINDVGRGESKKSPEPFRKALAAIEVKPEEAVYVGDNPMKDFVGSKLAGLHTVRITRKKGEYAGIRREKVYEADYEISSLRELCGVIAIIDRKCISKGISD